MSATPQRCADTEPHGSHRYEVDQDGRGYVWSWLNCPGVGTVEPAAEPERASIDADTIADMIRAERELAVRGPLAEFKAVSTALDSLTARLATHLDPETYVEFFKRCGHTGT